MLPIAPSTYRDHLAKGADPEKLSARAERDLELKPEIERVFAETFEVYGARKVWRQMLREGFAVARCTVERLMADLGLHGAIRGKPVRSTVQDKAAPCPLDHVNRVFHAPAPNRLWLSDSTDVSTWSGFVSVAFAIDAYARRIVGWRVSRTAHASFVLDALEHALHERRAVHHGGLVHHSDRESQSVSIRSTERLAEAGIEPSVGSVGASDDNALAETINGLYKAEVIHRRGPWRSFEAVEFATLTWVEWFNDRRLLEGIGNIPPAEAEERYDATLDEPAMAASLKPNRLRQIRGGSVRGRQPGRFLDYVSTSASIMTSTLSVFRRKRCCRSGTWPWRRLASRLPVTASSTCTATAPPLVINRRQRYMRLWATPLRQATAESQLTEQQCLLDDPNLV